MKAVKGLCAPFVITKFIVSVYLNFTNSGPVEKRGFWVPKIICDATPTDPADSSERYKNMRDLK